MKLHKVYRVESKDKDGPYHGWRDLDLDGSPSCRKPMPHYDGLEDIDDDEYFGFESLEAMQYWFDRRDRDVLHEAAFKVSVYHAKHVKKGGAQLVFKMATAKRVTRLSLHKDYKVNAKN